MNLLVTGGCGFIGSNFINYLLNNNEKGIEKIINIDKQTYAGKGGNLEHMGVANDKRYLFIKGDICDEEPINRIFSRYKPEMIFNFAAESHVDRSISDSSPFVQTNIEGVRILLESSIKNNFPKFVQISTDEVYGSLDENSLGSKETDTLKPRNPYSASKAAAELLAQSYFHTHGLPVIITRSSNNYGPYQFPEKILPKFITNLIQSKKVPLMWSEENPGLNVRDWLHVEDNCKAIWFASQKGSPGEIYNIAGGNERTNIEITRLLLDYFDYGDEIIKKVPHRKGHDFRYFVDMTKLRKLGFSNSKRDPEKEIQKLCEWYKQNRNWWEALK